jgi:hypothetical protein
MHRQIFSQIASRGGDTVGRRKHGASKQDRRTAGRKMVRASLRETLKQRLDEIVVLEITQEGYVIP